MGGFKASVRVKLFFKVRCQQEKSALLNFKKKKLLCNKLCENIILQCGWGFFVIKKKNGASLAASI